MATFCIFFTAFFVYASQAYFSYVGKYYTKTTHYLIACVTACLASILWATLARMHQNSDTYRLAIIWDLMIVSTYMFLPIILQQVKLAPINFFGIIMVIIGSCLIHLR